MVHVLAIERYDVKIFARQFRHSRNQVNIVPLCKSDMHPQKSLPLKIDTLAIVSIKVLVNR